MYKSFCIERQRKNWVAYYNLIKYIHIFPIFFRCAINIIYIYVLCACSGLNVCRLFFTTSVSAVCRANKHDDETSLLLKLELEVSENSRVVEIVVKSGFLFYFFHFFFINLNQKSKGSLFKIIFQKK